MGLHPQVVAAFSSHDAFARVGEGVVRLRDGCDVGAIIEPSSTVRELAKADLERSGMLVATDLLTPPCSDGPSLSRRMSSLEALRGSRQDVPVVAFLGRWHPDLAWSLRGMGIRVVVPGDEDITPGAIAVALGETLLPEPAVRFLAALPEELRPRYRLALTRGVMRPGANWAEEDLARWAEVDADRLVADFRRARVGTPARWCLWGHLYQVAEGLERSGEALDEAVGALGISDPAGFLEACQGLLDADPRTLLGRDGTERVLRALVRWDGSSERGRLPGGGPATESHRKGGKSATGSLATEATLSAEEAPHLEALYRAYAGAIRRGAREGGASDDDADDIAHEVMLALVKGGSVAPGQTLSAAYFRRAGRNRAQNRGKARDAQAVSLDDLNEEVLGSGRRPAPGASRRPHRLEALRDAIRRLPEPERSVARLCELEGWKVPEVAIVLGLSERTVKRRKADSKTLLEADLGLPPPP